MPDMRVHRHKAFFYLILSALGIILLAVGLPTMQLQPGLPIPGAELTNSANPIQEIYPVETNNVSIGWLFQGALAIGFFLLLFMLITSLIRNINGKRIFQLSAGLTVVIILLFLLPHVIGTSRVTTLGEEISGNPPQLEFMVAPIGNPPANLYWFVISFLLLAILVLCAWLLTQVLRKPKEENPLLRAAGAALLAIEEGQDLKNVIIHCYLNMVRYLNEEQGFEREASVTPREFEYWLTSQGVPDTPVRQLTSLFEKARYGNTSPDQQDEQTAVTCLSAILSYSRQSGKSQA